jgi:L-iditol 2-dehydrogenase/galactitol-1-phosphate 5-dehydrogenase
LKAAVLEAKGTFSFKEVPRPEKLGPTSTLVRIGAVGVCGSDVLRFGVGKGYGFPLVLGHEMAGVVEEASPSGKFNKGDKVAIFPCLPKPHDPFTKIGEWSLSEGYDYFGSRRDGGMQELLEVPEENLVKLPSEMPLVVGAMVEPAGVSLHAVRKAQLSANASVLVIGGGPIGNFAAQWLNYLGATNVFVADVDPKKLKVAEAVGLSTIDVSKLGIVEQASKSSNPRGFDIVVEATGLPIAVKQAIEVSAPMGQIVLLGDLSADLELAKEMVSQILRKELTILGTWNAKIQPAFASEWDMVINAVGKGLELAPLLSHVGSLENAQLTFENLYGRKHWYNKVSFAISDQAKAEAKMVLSASLSAKLASS